MRRAPDGRPFQQEANECHCYYGGHRPGDNLFGESLVAVSLEPGERLWHFQFVHHPIWDYDVPCPPILVDIVVDGREIQAVAQPTKQGWVYVFDRVTGEPVWPIEERPVPAGNVPGEWYSPTQPFPTKPPPFERQGFRLEELIDFTPELREAALEIVSRYKIRTGLYAADRAGRERALGDPIRAERSQLAGWVV